MENQSSKEDLREKLKDTEASIEGHYQALKDEVGSVGEKVGRIVRKRPVAGAFLAVGVGLLVGAIFGKRRNHTPSEPRMNGLAGSYLDEVAASAESAIERGQEPREAVRDAVGRYYPVLALMKPDGAEPRSRGLIGRLFSGMTSMVLQALLYSASGMIASFLGAKAAEEDEKEEEPFVPRPPRL
jgi:hypothetical protein